MYIVLTGRFAILKGELELPTIIGYRGAGEIVAAGDSPFHRGNGCGNRRDWDVAGEAFIWQ